MTTIAYRNGILATDSRATAGGTIVDMDTRKLVPDGKGGVYAFCGELELAMETIDHLLGDYSHERLNNKTTVIHLRPDGTIWEMSDRHFIQLHGEFYSWGSGHQAARAAMILHATAEQAVEVATQCDPNTGGAVQVFKVKPKSASRKRKGSRTGGENP